MEEKREYERFINYETALASLFRELNLKESHCQLIRAFILISKGESIFEASFNELGNVFHKKNSKSRIDSKARNAFKGLEKWQNENQMQLIKVLVKGRRSRNRETGQIEYIKTKYQFIVLDEVVKLLYSDSDQVEQQLHKLIATIKADFKPKDTVRTYHPLHNLKKARNTVITKAQKVFEFAKEAGLNPQQEFEKIINMASSVVSSLILVDEYEQNSKNFIKQFENELDKNMNNKKELVTE